MTGEPPYTDPPATLPQSEHQAQHQAGSKVYASDIDPELKTIAMQQMLNALKGNGIKPDDVEITEFEGQTLEFLAMTELKLDSNLTIKHQAGKLTGPKLLQNSGQFQEELAKEVNKIAHSYDVIERIRDAVLERKDKGLCLKNIKIKLPFLHKDFVAHEPCKPCAAKGKINCTRCHGKRQMPCPRCQARGTETCPTCGGRQYIQGPNNQNQQCMRCNGAGRTSCSQCHESKTVQCRQCRGAGAMTCQQCNGHAWNSIIGMATIDPVAFYSFERAEIPKKALDKLDLLESDIQHHADIQVVRRPKEIEQEHDDISIPYHIKAPMADVMFRIKTLEVPAFLFGIQGVLYDAPSFLEKVMGPGIKSLKLAGQGHGDVAAHLQKAGRYRTLRTLILATAKAGPKKALKLVMDRTPLGLSEDSAKKLVILAHNAIGLIGKKPKMIGIALGLLIALGSGGGYYVAGREAIMPLLPSTQMGLAVDALAALIALGGGYMIGDMYKKAALKKALESLFAKR